jgi:hypothetical protein
VQCHGLYEVFAHKKTKEAWDRTIAQWMWRGAQMLPGEAEIMRDYLLSVSSGSTEIPPASLPEGPGKKLVQRSCMQCHGLRTVVSKPRSAAEWKSSVQDHVDRLGARLDASEAETVIEYLSKFYGR